jgi:hypothetical protein
LDLAREVDDREVGTGVVVISALMLEDGADSMRIHLTIATIDS